MIDSKTLSMLEGGTESLLDTLLGILEATEPPSHAYKVGDILVSSWGYDQTNATFYRVMKITSKSVRIQKIEGEYVSYGSSAKKIPKTPYKTTGKLMTKRATRPDSIKISSYEYARPWNGKPVYVSDPMGGH